MTQDDRWFARRLPDDFLGKSGDAITRIRTVVTENWWAYQEGELSELAEALLPVLDGLTNPGAQVADDHRLQCEEVVEQWFAGR
jgi:hypothetical protein